MNNKYTIGALKCYIEYTSIVTCMALVLSFYPMWTNYMSHSVTNVSLFL